MVIYTNSIVNALYTIISSWTTLVNSGVTVEQDQEFNTDPNKTPWVGVYSPYIVFEPYRSNIINPYNVTFNLEVYPQVGDFGLEFVDGAKRLNDLSGAIFTAVSCYRDLMGTVNIIKGGIIEPYRRDIEESNPLFSNKITIIADVFG